MVDRRDELLPDAEVDVTLELLAELPDASLVCTHREVITQLFAGELTCPKGGAWVIERVDSIWSPTVYAPPPSSVAEAFPRAAFGR